MKTKTLLFFFAGFLIHAISSGQDTLTSRRQDTLASQNDSLPVFYATAKVTRYTGNLHDLEGMSTVKLNIATNVNPNATNAFHDAFKGASNDMWFFHDKKGKDYLVKFDYAKRDYKVLLDQKGKVFYTMFDGIEKDLSSTIRKNIKAWYPDYTVVGLVHVKTTDRDASLVNLKNGGDFVIISVEDDVISEIGLQKMTENKQRSPKKKSTTTSF